MRNNRFALATLGLALALSISAPASAQIAGASVVGVTVAESVQLAYGWSAKKSMLGKTVYNDAGQKVGKVQDLIVSPQKNVSYLIIGAGGFAGIGRHDVAIPFSQIQERGGRLVMPGATQEAVKQMPAFAYAKDNARRDQFIAVTEQDIAQARIQLADVQKKAAEASADMKVKLDAQVATLEADVKAVETKLDEMKRASVSRWRDFEGEVGIAMDRMHKAFDAAKG
jgi:sporulation protein YlmC with PRC-barrel domain